MLKHKSLYCLAYHMPRSLVLEGGIKKKKNSLKTAVRIFARKPHAALVRESYSMAALLTL